MRGQCCGRGSAQAVGGVGGGALQAGEALKHEGAVTGCWWGGGKGGRDVWRI